MTKQFRSKLPRPQHKITKSLQPVTCNNEQSESLESMMESLQRIQSLKIALDNLQSQGTTPKTLTPAQSTNLSSTTVNDMNSNSRDPLFKSKDLSIDELSNSINEQVEYEDDDDISVENEYLQEYYHIENVISALNEKADKVLQKSETISKSCDNYKELKQMVDDVEVDAKDYKKIIKMLSNEIKSESSETESEVEITSVAAHSSSSFIQSLQKKFRLSETLQTFDASIQTDNKQNVDGLVQTDDPAFVTRQCQTMPIVVDTNDRSIQTDSLSDNETESTLVNSEDEKSEYCVFDFYDDETEFETDPILMAMRQRLREKMIELKQIDELALNRFY